MRYVNLGRAGLKVSRIALGAFGFGTPQWRDWVLSEEQCRPIIRRALEAGINFFDTANSYSKGVSEEVLGRALREMAHREEVVIATKVYFPTGTGPNDRGLSRKHIMEAVDASLKRLGTDYIDLYQTHRWDNEVTFEEALEALHDLVKAGKVCYIGASSMHAWEFAKALYVSKLHGWTRFVAMQNHYNLVYREEEREMIPLCRTEGIGVTPWSPLARGFLTRTRDRSGNGTTPRAKQDWFTRQAYSRSSDFEILDRVIELASRRGVKPAQVALAWLLHQPGVTAPIVGSTKLEHLEEALAALDIELSESEQRYLEEPYEPHPVLGIDER